MARPLRLEFAGTLYHVLARGNERTVIVRDDASRSIAAYLARRRFGYRATEVALALGYRSPSSVTRAVGRVESSMPRLQETAAVLEAKLHYSLFKL